MDRDQQKIAIDRSIDHVGLPNPRMHTRNFPRETEKREKINRY